MIVDKAVYRDGVRHPCDDLSDAVDSLEDSDNGFVWIGLKDPTPQEFALVNNELHLHPLAVEDALVGKQRVKVERYDGSMFAVLRTLSYVEETSDIETGEIMVFIGPHFVVTVRHGELHPLAEVRRRLELHPTELAEHGTTAVLHAVLDTIVDRYVEIDDEIARDLDDVEAEVFGGMRSEHSGTIYRLKREILEFRRAATPLASPLSVLYSENGPITSPEMRLRFRDVADHVSRVVEHLDGYDRLLTDAFGAHMAQVSVQQNNDMRKLSAWLAMAAPPTLVASVFGMNFRQMPGLDLWWGFPVTIAVVALACGLLYRAFRKSGWL